MNVSDIEHRFSYHPPTGPAVVEMHEAARDLVKHVAHDLDALVPEGREKALMMTNLEQALFWANAAIARHANVNDESWPT